MCINSAEELSYKTRSTSRGIPTMLCLLILLRSSSTRQGAPIGVYLPCCVCKYCRGALQQDKEHQWEYIYHVVCVNTTEELFCKTRSTSRGKSTLLCVLILLKRIFTWIFSYWCSLSCRRAPLQYLHTQQSRYTPTGARYLVEELLCNINTHNRVDILTR